MDDHPRRGDVFRFSTPFWDASREARVPSSSCKTMRATGAAKLSSSPP